MEPQTIDFPTIAREYFLKWATENPDLSLGIGAIQSFDHCLQEIPTTDSTTASTVLAGYIPTITTALRECFPGSMSVQSACQIFASYVSRTDFEQHEYVAKLRNNSACIARAVRNSHGVIHKWVNSFLRDGQIILVHSYSHVVTSALLSAALQGKRFRLVITESRPECEGYALAEKLKAAGIPVTLIVDSMVAHVLETVDIILVGAEAVVENGGIINKMGTYQLGIVAKALNKPMYVLAESFKFTHQFIFHQHDIQNNKTTGTIDSKQQQQQQQQQQQLVDLPAHTTPPQHGVDQKCTQPHLQQRHRVPLVIKDALSAESLGDDEYLDHKWDYTPPEFITLIFSDLGILSPSAVSDELLKLYY